jgi:hypothetical protein
LGQWYFAGEDGPYRQRLFDVGPEFRNEGHFRRLSLTTVGGGGAFFSIAAVIAAPSSPLNRRHRVAWYIDHDYAPATAP